MSLSSARVPNLLYLWKNSCAIQLSSNLQRMKAAVVSIRHHLALCCPMCERLFAAGTSTHRLTSGHRGICNHLFPLLGNDFLEEGCFSLCALPVSAFSLRFAVLVRVHDERLFVFEYWYAFDLCLFSLKHIFQGIALEIVDSILLWCSASSIIT